jgi:hypothetical protein
LNHLLLNWLTVQFHKTLERVVREDPPPPPPVPSRTKVLPGSAVSVRRVDLALLVNIIFSASSITFVFVALFVSFLLAMNNFDGDQTLC